MFLIVEGDDIMEWLGIILTGLTIAVAMRVSYIIGSKTGYMKGYKEGMDTGWRLGAFFGYEKEVK